MSPQYITFFTVLLMVAALVLACSIGEYSLIEDRFSIEEDTSEHILIDSREFDPSDYVIEYLE